MSANHTPLKSKTILTKQDLGFDLKVTWLAYSKLFTPLALRHDITVTMGFTLLNISTDKGTPATKIAPLLGMEPRSLTRLIKKMEIEGLVVRKPDPEDRRSVRIFLTEKGLEKKQIAKQNVEEFNRVISAEISNAELGQFFDTLEKLHQIIQKHKISA